MSIDIRGLRLSLERRLAGFLESRDIRTVGTEAYRVTGGRARVRLTAERRFEIVIAFTALRTSSGIYVRDIELDCQAAVAAEVIRFLLDVGVGVEFTVTTAAFFGSVRTVATLNRVPTPHDWI